MKENPVCTLKKVKKNSLKMEVLSPWDGEEEKRWLLPSPKEERRRFSLYAFLPARSLLNFPCSFVL